jgi:hypothetical protein
MITRAASEKDKAKTFDILMDRCDDFGEERPSRRGGRRLILVLVKNGSLATMPVREDDLPESWAEAARS